MKFVRGFDTQLQIKRDYNIGKGVSDSALTKSRIMTITLHFDFIIKEAQIADSIGVKTLIQRYIH